MANDFVASPPSFQFNPQGADYQKALAKQQAGGKKITTPTGGAFNPDSVWMGERLWTHIDADKGVHDDARKSKNPRGEALNDAMVKPWEWNQKQWQTQMARAGVTTRDEFMQVWSKAVDWANQSWQATKGGANGKPITPFDALDLIRRETATSVGGARTQTQKSVEEISDGQAWSVIDGAVRNAMGRGATDAEMRRFIARAHDLAARNPNISTTTSQQSVDGKSSSTTQHSKTGTSEADYQLAAAKMAADDPEAGAFQAAGPLFKALVDALGATVNVSNPAGV